MKKFLFVFLTFCSGFLAHADPFYWGASGQKPLEVAINFLQGKLPDGDSEGLQKVVIEQTNLPCLENRLCNTPIQIILEINGLADDSVQAIRYRLVLEQPQNQPWQVVLQEEQFLCRKGRGQTDFSSRRCL